MSIYTSYGTVDSRREQKGTGGLAYEGCGEILLLVGGSLLLTILSSAAVAGCCYWEKAAEKRIAQERRSYFKQLDDLHMRRKQRILKRKSFESKLEKKTE